MLREEDIALALIAYKQGRSGFALDPETMEVKSFEDVFLKLTRNRYMIDWPDQPEEKQEPAEEQAEDPVEEEQKLTDPFERYEKYGPFSKPEKKKRHRPNQKEIEQNILKAWDCGNRSFDEVVKRTGYSAKTVERFLPHNCKA